MDRITISPMDIADANVVRRSLLRQAQALEKVLKANLEIEANEAAEDVRAMLEQITGSGETPGLIHEYMAWSPAPASEQEDFLKVQGPWSPELSPDGAARVKNTETGVAIMGASLADARAKADDLNQALIDSRSRDSMKKKPVKESKDEAE